MTSQSHLISWSKYREIFDRARKEIVRGSNHHKITTEKEQKYLIGQFTQVIKSFSFTQIKKYYGSHWLEPKEFVKEMDNYYKYNPGLCPRPTRFGVNCYDTIRSLEPDELIYLIISGLVDKEKHDYSFIRTILNNKAKMPDFYKYLVEYCRHGEGLGHILKQLINIYITLNTVSSYSSDWATTFINNISRFDTVIWTMSHANWDDTGRIFNTIFNTAITVGEPPSQMTLDKSNALIQTMREPGESNKVLLHDDILVKFLSMSTIQIHWVCSKLFSAIYHICTIIMILEIEENDPTRPYWNKIPENLDNLPRSEQIITDALRKLFGPVINN